MEYIPDTTSIQLCNPYQINDDGQYNQERGPIPLTPEQERKLRRIYEMINGSRTGYLSLSEFKDALRACDVPVENNEHLSLLYEQYSSKTKQQKLTYDEWRSLMHTQSFHQIQHGRYYVGLSLEEAETIRAILHSTLIQSSLLQSHTVVGLRVGHQILDSSRGFIDSTVAQTMSAEQCYRYLNSELYYTDDEIGTLLRCLSETPLIRREAFFQEIRSCRRRPRREWQQSSIVPLFTHGDWLSLVEFRSIMTAVRTRIRARGLRLMDAFKAFDYNRDGKLSCSELYGGLTWLGMNSLIPEDIYAIMKHIDKSNAGLVQYQHFEQAFRDHEHDNEDELAAIATAQKALSASAIADINADMDITRTSIEPRKIRELYASEEKEDVQLVEEIPYQALSRIQVSIERVKSFIHVWNSKGTFARKDVSIWDAEHPSSILSKRNRVRVNLGHYAILGLGQPSKGYAPSGHECYTIELTDLSTSTMFRSKYLDPGHINWLLPYPTNYKLVWSIARGEQQMYAWKAIPPTQHYVALGMIVTTVQDPPALTSMRCVPRAWTIPTNRSPVSIWDDAGSAGGRRGSMWIVNSLKLAMIVENHDRPDTKGVFDLMGPIFMASDGYESSTHSAAPARTLVADATSPTAAASASGPQPTFTRAASTAAAATASATREPIPSSAATKATTRTTPSATVTSSSTLTPAASIYGTSAVAVNRTTPTAATGGLASATTSTAAVSTPTPAVTRTAPVSTPAAAPAHPLAHPLATPTPTPTPVPTASAPTKASGARPATRSLYGGAG